MSPTPGPIIEPLDERSSDLLGDNSFVLSPRVSNLSGSKSKGLLNMPGQNNCFLNSAVQVLWHLDIFRRSFRELTNHSCMQEACIFCALKELFTQFQYSRDSALPPDALRHALAKTFCDQRRFQLGFMDDAAECFENILWRIHVHIASKEHEDMCGDVKCIPHQKFAMTLVEQPECHNCSATSELLPFTQMVHYVTTSALCSKAAELQNHGLKAQSSFGTLLQLAGDVGEVRTCSSGCGSKISVKKTLMNHPEIVSIGLVWDSECPSLDHIREVFQSIGMSLRLKDMFHAVYDYEWANNTYHELVGVVTYYGKHYSTFFFHTKLRVWIYFDDAVVREIGPSWELVVEKCEKGRFQPLLLLFANPNGGWLHQPNESPLQTDQKHQIPRPFTSEKQAVIQKYLAMQKQIRNGFRTNCKTSLEFKNNLSYHQRPTYLNKAPSFNTNPAIRTLNKPSQMPVYSNLKTLNTTYKVDMPVYANTTKLGIQVPEISHDYHLLTEAQLQNNSKANEVCLPPIGSMKYSTRDLNDNPACFQYNNNQKSGQDQAKDSDSAFTDDPESSDTYISRKTVENVLNLQKQQRHLALNHVYNGTVGNRNSNSSLESFDNMQGMKLNFSRSVDSGSNLQRRDSGNWSGDRNSSSSCTSAENPFLAVVASRRLLFGQNSSANTNTNKGQVGDYTGTNMSDHGYDSYSVSSSDSYLSITNSPVKAEPRLTQIPEDWSSQDFSTHLEEKLKIITKDDYGPPDCDKLCAEADLLLSKSHDKEKEGDLIMAALLSDSAAARARAAMDAPYNNSRSLVSAKMKHSTCVMRSSCLYRRLKDNESDERKKSKGHHSRQSSRDSTHSRHSRQNSKDGSSAKQIAKDLSSQFDEEETIGKSIDIYGTLPKKGSRKKSSSSTPFNKMKDDQIYKDFLEKQRKNTDYSGSISDYSPKELSNVKSISFPTEKFTRRSLDSTPAKSPTCKRMELSKSRTDQQYFTSPDSDCTHSADGKDSSLTSPDKKQHKIKRKLMGSFMRRKNRSLPDLRADDELSDDFEQSIDDAAFHKSLPSDKLKKIDSNVSNLARGFHQPHYAFIKKDSSQRSLLVKVNPPSINPTALTGTSPKQQQPLPSIPKKSSGFTTKKDKDISFNNSDRPSKIPFMTSLFKSETTFPLTSDSKASVLHSLSQQKNSCIPLLSAQPIGEKLHVIDTHETPQDVAFNADVNLEDLPPPPNSFLEELQATRKQMNDNRVPCPEPNKSTSPPTLSQLPKMKIPSNGMSLLKELQNKHQQMQQLRSTTQPKTELSIQDSNRTELQKMPRNQDTDAHSQVLPNRIIVPDPPKIAQLPLTSPKTNVKDLASKFEKNIPKETMCISPPIRTTPRLEQNSYTMRKSSITTNSLHESYKDTETPQSTDTTDSKNYSSEDVTEKYQKTLDNPTTSRPQCPPDYETAMQRLELMRTNSQGIGKVASPTPQSVDKQVQGLPPFPSLPSNESPKKKSGPKKTVTFSDEVVLVACAEYDDSGFFNNPLLERVYQKHLESGGDEVPHFNTIGKSQSTQPIKGFSDSIELDNDANLVPCNLCQNKFVNPSSTYCADCSFYMSRYQK